MAILRRGTPDTQVNASRGEHLANRVNLTAIPAGNLAQAYMAHVNALDGVRTAPFSPAELIRMGNLAHTIETSAAAGDELAALSTASQIVAINREGYATEAALIRAREAGTPVSNWPVMQGIVSAQQELFNTHFNYRTGRRE